MTDQGKSKGEVKRGVQGEGDYDAARRYNESAREFVKENDVNEAARDAEPQDAAEQQQLEQAEQQGRGRAKDEDPLLDHPEDIEKALDESAKHRRMSKAFVKEADDQDDEELETPEIVGVRNYISSAGYRRLKDELLQLLNTDRPEVVRTVSWAASNGDRSENGDYIYGKKRLREIDRRIRFLTKRLDLAEVVDPAAREHTDQIFFGATVLYSTADGNESRVTIVGVDEVDPAHGYVSWISPIAAALLKARVGDQVTLRTPVGTETLDIVDVSYARS